MNSNNNNRKRIGVIIGCVAFLACVALYQSQKPKPTQQTEPPTASESPVTPGPKPAQTESTPATMPPAAIISDVDDRVIETIVIPLPDLNCDGAKPDISDEINEMTATVSKALDIFHETFSPTKAFICQNGFLYDVAAEEYFIYEDLFDISELDEKYKDKNLLLMYLQPKDLTEYFDITGHNQKLTLFAAYAVKGGYLFSSASGGGFVPDNGFKTLLEKYESVHGEIIRFGNKNENSAPIIKAIADYSKNMDEMDVRYLAGDDKHAFAVVSPRTNPAQIKEFVLVKNNGKWEVGLSDFEQLDDFRETISDKFPDINAQMLPKYSMFFHEKFIQPTVKFQPLIENMKEKGLITENTGQAVFVSGNDEFVYIEFENGRKLIGYLDKNYNAWSFDEVMAYSDAEVFMSSRSFDPPLFIVKQF